MSTDRLRPPRIATVPNASWDWENAERERGKGSATKSTNGIVYGTSAAPRVSDPFSTAPRKWGSEFGRANLRASGLGEEARTEPRPPGEFRASSRWRGTQRRPSPAFAPAHAGPGSAGRPDLRSGRQSSDGPVRSRRRSPPAGTERDGATARQPQKSGRTVRQNGPKIVHQGTLFASLQRTPKHRTARKGKYLRRNLNRPGDLK